jgi:hypothetical protein
MVESLRGQRNGRFPDAEARGGMLAAWPHKVEMKREGQDGDNAIIHPAPAGGSAPTARKKTGRSVVFLRLPDDAALVLRTSAEVRRLSPSAYVAGLVLGHERPDAVGSPKEIGIVEVSTLAHAVHRLPGEVKRLRGELMRQGGLLKHLAETTPITARLNDELAETLRTMIATAEAADAAAVALLAATAAIRNDLSRAAKILAAK